MPIHIATAPQQSIQAIQNVLQTWTDQPNIAPLAAHAGVNFAVAGGVQVSLPHPVYEMSLADLSSGKGLASARQVSWRYLVSDGALTASAETISQPGTAGQHEFSMINRGPLVASLVNTVAAVEKDTAFAGATYEVAVLQIPGIYFSALWLRQATPGNDVLIPLDPAPANLTAGQKYKATDLFTAISPAAQAVMKRSADPRSN